VFTPSRSKLDGLPTKNAHIVRQLLQGHRAAHLAIGTASGRASHAPLCRVASERRQELLRVRSDEGSLRVESHAVVQHQPHTSVEGGDDGVYHLRLVRTQDAPWSIAARGGGGGGDGGDGC